jgi:hypothetical protein
MRLAGSRTPAGPGHAPESGYPADARRKLVRESEL